MLTEQYSDFELHKHRDDWVSETLCQHLDGVNELKTFLCCRQQGLTSKQSSTLLVQSA